MVGGAGWWWRGLFLLAVLVLPGGSLLLLAAAAWKGTRKEPGGEALPLRLPAWLLPSAALVPARARSSRS
jgi:hypothetical protein